MITQIDIDNFRSIKHQKIPLKKLNILYGPNGSGKSSVMYAPYIFRNICVNPNQKIDSVFDLEFINLGGLKNVINGDPENDSIEIGFYLKTSNFQDPDNLLKKAYYEVSLTHSWLGDIISLELNDGEKHSLSFDLPSQLIKKKEIQIHGSKLLWNGLTFDSSTDTTAHYIAQLLNKNIYEYIKCIELISVRRGFFSPIYSTEQLSQESRFAMQIRDESTNFESKIDHYFKQIFDKTFRFVAIPGSTSFYLRTQNKKGFTTDLVNEGFGVNQTIYMLIKLLKRSTSLAFIEEPEIHLHPSAQNKLVDVFTEIIQKENKQIFLTTHSENIVSSVLNKIAKGELSTDDVQFYLAQVENDETKIIPQTVNEKGQIEGGLLSFMETELANLKTLLGV
jgi:predicted ATP-dependent endonuclease of OLD family